MCVDPLMESCSRALKKSLVSVGCVCVVIIILCSLIVIVVHHLCVIHINFCCVSVYLLFTETQRMQSELERIRIRLL